VASVRVVALHVPSSVRTGAEVELACLYELGNSSLYSLKWFYRANETDLDEQEFFRYTPSLLPHKQYFPIEGINVNVNKSEGGRVVIVETNGKTSGKYKCEISIDGTFQTVAAEKLMTVNDAPSTFWETYLPNSIKSHLPGGGGGGGSGGGGGGSRNNSGASLSATSPSSLQLLLLVVTVFFTITTKPNYQLTSERGWLSLLCQT
ncbi:hypothetical protein TYRP_004991, partial [Tyrophagus putrescentiae]